MENKPWRIVETGTVGKDQILHTTGIGSDGKRFTVTRSLDPTGVSLLEGRQEQDGPDERVVEYFYQRVLGPVRCTDVTRLDFKNLTIELEGELFPFHNGDAYQYARESLSIAHEDGVEPTSDFGSKIVFDRTVSPESKVAVRVLGIGTEYLKGPAWSRHLAGFTCSAGVLRTVFDRSAMSLSLEGMTDNEITVSMLPYDGKKTVKWWLYKWSEATQRYRLERAWLTPQRLCKTAVISRWCY